MGSGSAQFTLYAFFLGSQHPLTKKVYGRRLLIMDKLKAHNKQQRASRLARKKEAMKMREKMTLKEIGDAWGISKQAVWRILQ